MVVLKGHMVLPFNTIIYLGFECKVKEKHLLYLHIQRRKANQ